MRKTMLTFDLLTRFEREYQTAQYTLDELSEIETDARIAMFNRHSHYDNGENWTEDDIYADFLRCLNIGKITLIPNEPNDPNEEENTMEERFITALTARLDAIRNRSAWDKGVQQYAEELAEELAENIRGGYVDMDDMYSFKMRRAAMLNGAEDWMQYSWGGCSLIYNYQIAERLCNPSELKKTRGGVRRPNAREEWLDCQARALGQAWRRVDKAITDALETLMNSQPNTSDIDRAAADRQDVSA